MSPSICMIDRFFIFLFSSPRPPNFWNTLIRWLFYHNEDFSKEIQSTNIYSTLQHFRPYLKGQCHEIFCFWFFFIKISFPPAPEYSIKTVSNFFRKFAEIFASQGAPPISTTPVSTVSNCWQLKMNLKFFFYLYASSTTQRCPKEIIKKFSD